MRNVGYIFLKEYLERVRSKAFIIITILTPLIFAVIFGLPILLGLRGGQTQRVAVAETGPGAGRLLPLLEEQLKRRGDSRASFDLRREEVPPGRENEVRQRLRAAVLRGGIDAYLWVEGDPTADGRVEYNGRNVTDFAAIGALQSSISSAVVHLRLVSHGITAGQVQNLVKPTRMRTVRVSPTGEKEDRGMSFLMSFFFLMVLYMTLILYGVAVMRSVIEEKASRVFEVMLSAVKPIELLAGKILGVAAVGLTQYLAWTLLALLASGGMGLATLRTQMGEVSLPAHILPFFVLFFLFGYLLYSTMFAALGAMVNTEQEAQQLQIVIMQFLIVPVLVANMILRSPNSTLSTVLSLIPFFSPTLMFLRITVVTPPAWQIALSLLLLAVTIVGVLWVSARIYRVGILMYGKRPTLPELWRWLKAA